MARIPAVVAASLMLLGPAFAAEPPDRSTLSYEENVVINTACSQALRQGDDAFYACVRQQLAALQAHPSPDRSGLGAGRNKALETVCGYLRRKGIGEYNDCLGKTMTAAPPVEKDQADNELAPNLARIMTRSTGDKPAATPAAMAPPPLPSSVLPQRPDRIERRTLTPAELYKKVERSVFVVLASASLADARARSIMQGSAVAVGEHLLLTNCHVVMDRPLIKIVQDATVADATLAAADTAADRCVLKVQGLKLVPVEAVRSFDSLAVGERVFAVGTPRQLERTLSEGLVSGLRPQSRRNMVQTSAPMSPGSSGGGLFDEHGNLVGITTLQVVGEAQNLNFAIAAADFWR